MSPLSPGFLLSSHQYRPSQVQCSPAVGAPRQCLCRALAAPTPPGCCALLQQHLQQSCQDCHVLSGCRLDTAPSGWGTWKLFQGWEMDMCFHILSREGGCYRSAAEETAGTTPSNICRFWFYCHSFSLSCCLLKLNLRWSCRLSYWTNCKHPSYLYTL